VRPILDHWLGLLLLFSVAVCLLGCQQTVEVPREFKLPDESRFEARLHEYNLDFYKEHYRDYKEVNITTKKLPIGRARVAEFTATKGYGKLCGIRATAVTRDKGVTFRALVPESQWEDFKPVFYRMLNSMERGVKAVH